MINYDVPMKICNGRYVGDVKTYQHRVTRTGRMGSKGIALTLIETEKELQIL